VQRSKWGHAPLGAGLGNRVKQGGSSGDTRSGGAQELTEECVLRKKLARKNWFCKVLTERS